LASRILKAFSFLTSEDTSPITQRRRRTLGWLKLRQIKDLCSFIRAGTAHCSARHLPATY